MRISGTGELHYQTSRLDSPPRLVLDFADTRLAVARMKVSSEYAPVLDVRMGQPNPGQSRVVIDLGEVRSVQCADGRFGRNDFLHDARRAIDFDGASTLSEQPALHAIVRSTLRRCRCRLG